MDMRVGRVKSGVVGGQVGSTGRSSEPDLEKREKGLMIARQRALSEEGSKCPFRPLGK